MLVLGVDPGTWRTGIGLLESRGSSYHFFHAEVLEVREKKTEVADRLHQIYQGLKDAMSRFKPEIMALERSFFAKDVQALIKLGEARACAMLAASERGIAVVEYAPARVKQAVTGNGRATKEQMQHMVKTLLGLQALPGPDSADALALAICHAHSSRGKMLCTTTSQDV